MIYIIGCVTSRETAHGTACFMPVNCCESGQDQGLLRSPWSRECWKAPLVKLVLYFFGDVRQSLSPYLWKKKRSFASQALEVSANVSGFPTIAAALCVVLGPFSEGYSARDHPVCGQHHFWDGWILMKSTGGLCTKVSIDLSVELGSPWLPWQTGSGAPRLCNLSSLQPLPSLSWHISCDFFCPCGGATRIAGGWMLWWG